MSAIDDGGPAFPCVCPKDFQFANDGMSLRDWFAGQVASSIAAILMTADMGSIHAAAQKEGFSGSVDEYIAFRSLRVADAMLAARKEGK